MQQTEPRHDASLFPVQFTQKHKHFFVCARMRYAFLVKYSSCLATIDTAEKIEDINLGRS
jgi:hypothetical protein